MRLQDSAALHLRPLRAGKRGILPFEPLVIGRFRFFAQWVNSKFCAKSFRHAVDAMLAHQRAGVRLFFRIFSVAPRLPRRSNGGFRRSRDCGHTSAARPKAPAMSAICRPAKPAPPVATARRSRVGPVASSVNTPRCFSNTFIRAMRCRVLRMCRRWRRYARRALARQSSARKMTAAAARFDVPARGRSRFAAPPSRWNCGRHRRPVANRAWRWSAEFLCVAFMASIW